MKTKSRLNVRIEDQTNIQDHTLTESLPRYYELAERIKESKDSEIVFDLSKIKFTFPLFLELLKLLEDSSKKDITFENTTSYLNTVAFPDTIPLNDISVFKNANKTYLPLISCKPQETENMKESLATIMADKVSETANIPSSIKHALAYMLQEIIDNVTEHSKATRMYAMVQCYPKKGIIDFCIADNGQGIRKSYKSAGLNVKDDLQAMTYIASAYSSKDRPENESRGYGLFTSRRIATQGLSGEFLCISGDAVYTKIKDKEMFVNVKGLSVKGSAVALRINYTNDKFNLYNYLEY